MGPKRKVVKVTNKKKIDLIPYGFQGEGVIVPGLTPINMNEYTMVKDPNVERTKALESVFNLPSTSLTNILPPETDTEKTTVKEFVNLTPSVLTKKSIDPFTIDRKPGIGPVEVTDVEQTKQQLDFGDDEEDFELIDTDELDIDEEEKRGGKRRRRKMKTRKAVRKSKRGKKHSSSRKTKSKRRRTSVRRR